MAKILSSKPINRSDLKRSTSQIFTLDIEGISSKEITKSFGRPEDYIELHIFDLRDNLLFSDSNFKDYQIINKDIEESTLLNPTSKEPKIAADIKGAGTRDYETPGPNKSTEGYWFNTGIENLWVTNTPANSVPTSDGLVSEISVDPIKILNERGYATGKYKIKLNIQRNKIFDVDDNPFIIKEISPTRREIRSIAPTISNNNFGASVSSFIYEMEGSIYFKDYLLNFGKDQNIPGINVLLNKNTNKYELLLKTLDPLPSSIKERAPFKVVESITDPITFEVDLGTPEIQDDTIPLRGPNYKIDVKLNNSVPSGFKTYNDLLEYTLTSSYEHLLNRLEDTQVPQITYDYIRPVSESLESTDIPYHFENFVHFSSATERLKNFEYKIKLIELYNQKSASFAKITGITSTSSVVLNDRENFSNKKQDLIKGFDGYERFLYFESGTYSWPKSNTQSPYTLFSYTSSEATTWLGSERDSYGSYGGQLLSASLFDRQNDYALEDLIPNHIVDNPSNTIYSSFVNMIGQHFDHIWTHIKHMSKVQNTHHTRGISKDLVFHQLKSLGIDTFDQFENTNLIEYILGEGTTGSAYYDIPVSQSLVTASNEGSIPKGDITKEIWKRLYHNAPYLLKTKGTERGLRALMSCYGVPSTILNIKEYGGPTKDETTYKTFSYDKSSLALAGSSNTSTEYFIKTDWSSSLTDALQSSAKTIEFRIKPTRSNDRYHLFNLSGSSPNNEPILVLNPNNENTDISASGDATQWGKLDLYLNGSVTASTPLFPVYDGDFWNIFIGTEGTSGSDSSLTFGAFKSNFLRSVFAYSSSVPIGEVTRSLTFGDPYKGNTGGSRFAYFGGIPDNNETAYSTIETWMYTGSLQEIRYHFHKSGSFEMLSHNTLTLHALEPFMYSGNTHTSSYDELVLRLPLGSNLHKDSSSFHPNPDTDYIPNSSISSSILTSSWEEVDEVHHLPTPDTGIATTSEKVRIDGGGTILDDILSPTDKTETSLLDRQPQDFEDLGIFFSPTNELNEDIIYTLGSFRLDDYIGNPLPSVQTSSEYTNLKTLNKQYFRKVRNRYNYWDYIKNIQYIDHTLFKIIEQFSPFRANTKTGLLIEPNYLERNKFPVPLWPQTHDLQTMVSGSHQTLLVELTSHTSSKADRYEGNKLMTIHSQVGGGNVVTTNNLSFVTESVRHGGHFDHRRKETGTNCTIVLTPWIPMMEAAQAPIKPYTTSKPDNYMKYTSNTLMGNFQEGVKSRRYYHSKAIGNQSDLFENN
tara:strand:+ start:971 stop:4753 length:3783 start_codon:yes stop_codon:yes gene_type:complete